MILTQKKLAKLYDISAKPPVFEKSEDVFWTEPYISSHILNAHLNPETDDASRNPETIQKSAAWIADRTGGGSGRRLLDLGCGPGLYCAELNRLGFDVTGIDYSKNSIDYARTAAKNEGHFISYIHDDYIRTSLPSGFDVVTMIYGDFCTLSEYDRDLLLWKLRKVLNTGGYFIFDVFTKRYEKEHRLKTDWYFQKTDGFWHPKSHLVLEQSFEYPEYDTYLNQYLVLSSGSSIKKYHIWHHYYSKKTIESVLEKHRLKITDLYGDLTGAPFDPQSEWIGVVCRRLK